MGPCSSSGLVFEIKPNYTKIQKIFFYKEGEENNHRQTNMALKISRNMFVLTRIVVTYGCEPLNSGDRIGQNHMGGGTPQSPLHPTHHHMGGQSS
jgi:hypothetical protein